MNLPDGKWQFEIHEMPLAGLWKIHHGEACHKPVGRIIFQKEGVTAFGEVSEATGSGAMGGYKEVFESWKKRGTPFIEDANTFPAPLRFGMTSAFVHWQCKTQGRSLASYFDKDETPQVVTSYSIPILPLEAIGRYIEDQNLQRFHALKVKVGQGSSPVDFLKEVARHYKGKLRVDANESFPDIVAVQNFLEEVSDLPLELLEQPLSRSKKKESAILKGVSYIPIVGDESIQDGPIGPEVARQFHGINVKLMKAGSYSSALSQMAAAKEVGLKVMVGCMVETSLGISGALSIGQGADWYDLDGFLLFRKDPFQLVLEKQGQVYFNPSPKELIGPEGALSE